MYSIELQTIFYEYQNKNPKINTSFNLIIFTFNIRGKLSIIRCDKYILHHFCNLLLVVNSVVMFNNLNYYIFCAQILICPVFSIIMIIEFFDQIITFREKIIKSL